jgi:hypothetical protein
MSIHKVVFPINALRIKAKKKCTSTPLSLVGIRSFSVLRVIKAVWKMKSLFSLDTIREPLVNYFRKKKKKIIFSPYVFILFGFSLSVFNFKNKDLKFDSRLKYVTLSFYHQNLQFVICHMCHI